MFIEKCIIVYTVANSISTPYLPFPPMLVLVEAKPEALVLTIERAYLR